MVSRAGGMAFLGRGYSWGSGDFLMGNVTHRTFTEKLQWPGALKEQEENGETTDPGGGAGDEAGVGRSAGRASARIDGPAPRGVWERPAPGRRPGRRGAGRRRARRRPAAGLLWPLLPRSG